MPCELEELITSLRLAIASINGEAGGYTEDEKKRASTLLLKYLSDLEEEFLRQ